ncbi:MAG: radical SAM protein [Armatimonadota bacterium]|nr:MAG: radical SAM protein [Armatimonadota bacterium]
MKLAPALVNALRLRRAYRDLPSVNPALPARADIEPTTHCNFHCPHCPHTAAPTAARNHLSLADFARILDQLPTVYRIKLVGLGEPLLNPEFFDMVRAARRQRVRVLTTTNGSLLDPDRRRELLTSGLNHLNISIDAADPDTHARLRPGSHLEQIAEGIVALVRERGRRRSPAIRAWHVIQRDSTSEIPDLVSRCADWGVDALLCTAKLTNFGSPTLEECVRDRRALAEDIQRVLPEAGRRAALAGLEFRCPQGCPAPRRPGEGRPCRWPWGRTVITARGEVLPCPYAGGADGLILGRLLPSDGHPAQSFAEIWNGPAMQQLRQRIRAGDNPPFCRACYPSLPYRKS